MVSPPVLPRFVRPVVRRIVALAAARAVWLTLKATEEMANLVPPATPEDVLEILERLTPADWAERLVSERTGEAMHVFQPLTDFGRLYVKVVLRKHCLVVSCHEQVES